MLFAVLLLLSPQQKPKGSSDPRAELTRVEQVLYERVQNVSRTSAAHLLGMGDACRAYRIPGLGAFFVLAPRTLPVPGGSEVFFLEQLSMPPPPPGFPGMSAARARDFEAQREAELRVIEEQVREFQKEAQRAHEEADRLLDNPLQQMQKLKAEHPEEAPPAPAAAPAPPAPQAPGIAVVARPAQPPAPPWEAWIRGEERRESRTPAAIVRDVEGAVTDALEASVGSLESLPPDEFIVVAVDFYPQGSFGMPVMPIRTVVVKAKKKDLSEKAAGKLSPEDFVKRVEYIQY